MIRFFQKKPSVQKLQARYAKLMSEAHRLLPVNPLEGQAKFTEAQAVLRQIGKLD